MADLTKLISLCLSYYANLTMLIRVCPAWTFFQTLNFFLTFGSSLSISAHFLSPSLQEWCPRAVAESNEAAAKKSIQLFALKGIRIWCQMQICGNKNEPFFRSWAQAGVPIQRDLNLSSWQKLKKLNYHMSSFSFRCEWHSLNQSQKQCWFCSNAC